MTDGMDEDFGKYLYDSIHYLNNKDTQGKVKYFQAIAVMKYLIPEGERVIYNWCVYDTIHKDVNE
jgi:hypothetical protein